MGAGRFDLVYTGIGALCWLPDVQRWAGVVAALLRPGGRLFMREGHPVLWAIDDPRPDSLLVLVIRFRGIRSAPPWRMSAVASTVSVRRRNGYRSPTRSRPSSRRDAASSPRTPEPLRAVAPPGHDAWIVGKDACVVVDWQGFSDYARRT